MTLPIYAGTLILCSTAYRYFIHNFLDAVQKISTKLSGGYFSDTLLAAVLQDVRKRVDEDDVRNPHVLALNREKWVDFRALFWCDLFHDCALLDFYVIFDSRLSMDPSKNLVLTGPKPAIIFA